MCLCLFSLLSAASVHAQKPVVLLSPALQAQQDAQQDAQQEANSGTSAQGAPASDPAAADPNAPCSTDLQCQQQLVALALVTRQYSEDTDVLASQSLSVQRVGFDALLGVLFGLIVLGLTVPNLLRKSNA